MNKKAVTKEVIVGVLRELRENLQDENHLKERGPDCLTDEQIQAHLQESDMEAGSLAPLDEHVAACGICFARMVKMDSDIIQERA